MCDEGAAQQLYVLDEATLDNRNAAIASYLALHPPRRPGGSVHGVIVALFAATWPDRRCTGDPIPFAAADTGWGG